MKSSKINAIILCGGKGSRTHSEKNKVLCYFGAKTALEYCLDAFTPLCDNVVVVAAEKDFDEINGTAKIYGEKVTVTLGGKTRFESVKNGLKLIGDGIVLIHDGARPFVTEKIIKDCIDSALKYGSGVAAIKQTDTLKTVCDDTICGELDREHTYCVQTPQAFDVEQIKNAYNAAKSDLYTDDSAVYLAFGGRPKIVLGSIDNKKITTAEDLISTPPCQNIGCGVDFHVFAPRRKLIIGGVQIPYDKGLLGNSDADVLAHAVMDALLSAIGQPDIGVLFPCTDEFSGADSMKLLETVVNKVSECNKKIISVSATIMAQAPKMKNYIPLMRQRLCDVMRIRVDQVNVSATTTEGLGVIGEGKGIAASAVCLLQ